MTFGVKTNERPGTRAQVRYSRMSAYKARQVLDLIRGKEVQQALEILQFVERDAAIVIRKCLASAMANAEHNDQIDSDELYVSACFADEGPTLKRWRPRARGRATRIRKRTCHITIIVTRLSEEQLERRRRREEASPAAAGRGRRRSQALAQSRASRVAKSRQRAEAAHDHDHEGEDHDHEDDVVDDELLDADTDVVETDAEADTEVDVETAEAEPAEAEPEDAADEDTDDAGKEKK
ncbi:MAG: large subunit ribosomal protein [Acidimicrobiaceae bacterium]|jgi:large subunit ribosomal protein L22